MKKMIALLLAMVLVIGMLAGCSKKSNKKSTDKKETDATQTEGTADGTGAARPESTGTNKDENKPENKPTGESKPEDKEENKPTDTEQEENNGDNQNPPVSGTGNDYQVKAVLANYYFVDYIRDVCNYYGESAGMYLQMMGLDINAPLNTQSYESSRTWADYFMEDALEQVKIDLAMQKKGKAEGFQLPASQREAIEQNAKMLAFYATNLGYSSVDQYLETYYGPGVSLESYNEYVELTTYASSYAIAYRDGLTFTEEQIRAYDDGSFDDYSTTQYVANVRHLLVEFAENTDAGKAVAKAEAERLLQVWKDGAATEESFVALVKEFTDDPGSVETGGLYEDIHPQSPYVEAFLNWAIDPARKVGDMGIVETEYGYHIMYLSSFGKLTYRDYIITEEMRYAQMEDWHNELIGDSEITVADPQNLRLDLVISTL